MARGKMPAVFSIMEVSVRPILRVALAVTALAVLGAPASAQTIEAARIAAVKKAADAFATLAAGSHKTGQPPRQSDPKVKALLDTVFDVKAIPVSKPLPLSELVKVGDWQSALLKVGLVYILAGTGVDDLSKAGNEPAFAQRADKNGVDFAPEFGRYLDTQMRLHAALLMMVNAHLAANPKDRDAPNFKKGLPQIQLGAAQSLASSLTTIALPGFSDAWRRERMPGLFVLAPPLAQGGDPGDVKELQGMAADVAGRMTDPALQADFNKLSSMLAR